MNKFDKEIRRIKNPRPFRAWWNRNSYKVYRAIFFPAYIIVLIKDKLHNRYISKVVFTDDEAKRIVDKVLPRHVAHDMDDDGSFMLCRSSGEHESTPDLFWGFDRNMNRREKSYFWKFHDEFIEYVFKRYEIDGYKKYLSPGNDFITAAGLEDSWYEFKNKPGAIFFKKML